MPVPRGKTSRRRACRPTPWSTASRSIRTARAASTSQPPGTSRATTRRICIHTDDYGATWRTLTKGIDRGHFTRVIRADRNTPGLLYAGTEFGLYVSTDDGANWRSFQLNLPEVPITDLALKDNDLIVATQGRSFWLLDDLDVLWQGLEDFDAARVHLFQPHPTVGYGGGNGSESATAGTNHPAGVRVNYHVPKGVENASLTFRDSQGTEIRSYKGSDLDVAAGLNHFDWDMRYEKADDFDGLLMWWGTLNGPVAPPGNYTVELAVDLAIRWCHRLRC